MPVSLKKCGQGFGDEIEASGEEKKRRQLAESYFAEQERPKA
jgi:hypothetical protein